MLQRIYGTAWADKDELDAHLKRIEEAHARDHRKLGKELDLFMFSHFAPSMPIFLPKGAAIYNELVDFVREFYRRDGYSEVVTPLIWDTELFKISGHYDNYNDNMFFSEVDEREYGVKPMNCPGHTQIFAMERRSYRDLPIRYADFARLHRYERSGVTHGLVRVRSFAQDDAHLFVTRGSDRAGDRPRAAADQGDLRHLRLQGSAHRALDPSREAARRRRDVGRRGERARERAEEERRRLPHQPRRRRVLRTEARVPGHRRHRPSVAARHHPARLRAAGALQARATSAPTTASTSR